MDFDLKEKVKVQRKLESEENSRFLSSFAQDAIIQIVNPCKFNKL